MNQESPCNSIQATLARLEEKMNKIDRTLHPPFWVKLLRWIGRNFFTIVLIIILIILSYKAWDMYQDLLFRIESIKNIPSNTIDSGKDAVQNVIEQLKFW